MTIIAASIGVPWGDGTLLAVAKGLPWADGTAISTTGSTFTAPDPPAGSTSTAPSLAPDHVLNPGALTSVVHTVVITDLRDSAVLEFNSLSITTDDGSVCWSLSASAPAAMFARFTADGDLPVISVVIDGMEWQFLIEGVRCERTHGNTTVSLTGRSTTITTGEPYEFPVNWINDGPSSAAQLVTQAHAFTTLEVDWAVDDWLVPDKVWSFTGTPLAVARNVADSIGAVIVSDRKDFRISIAPRYRVLPNEWPYVPPDVEIHLSAAMLIGYERADQPAYNGVYLSGQQQGVVGHVFLTGTLGDKLAPFATDLLLTDLEAVRQRGTAILGRAGPAARVQMTLPVLITGSAPGVLDLGWLCSVVDDEVDPWYGMVRSVTVNVALPSVTQTIVLERHTKAIEGTVVTET